MALDSQQISRQIYHTIKCIPMGVVSSYGQIADLAGLPGRARAVGYWLKRTPEGLVLPWYRVLRADGKIAFPVNSEAFKLQRIKLVEEGVLVKNGRVNMNTFGWKPDITTLLHDLSF